MRKVFFTLVSFFATVAFAENDGFVVSDVSLSPGTTSELTIGLNNATPYTAFQFDLEVPEGVTVVTDEKGSLEASLDDARKDDHVLAAAKVGDNLYRFLCYSLTNADLKETAGTVIHVQLSAAADLDTSAELKVTLKDGLLVTKEALGTDSESDSGNILTIQQGDVNNDGEVDILDAVLVIKYSLGKNPTGFIVAAADMNGDNEIDILDAVLIIKKSLKKAGARSAVLNKEELLLDPQ